MQSTICTDETACIPHQPRRRAQLRVLKNHSQELVKSARRYFDDGLITYRQRNTIKSQLALVDRHVFADELIAAKRTLEELQWWLVRLTTANESSDLL